MDVLTSLAVIILAVEAFLVTLVPLVVIGALAYGLLWLRRHENLPSWLTVGRNYLRLALTYVELATLMVVKPILAIHRALATVEAWVRGIVRLGGGK